MGRWPRRRRWRPRRRAAAARTAGGGCGMGECRMVCGWAGLAFRAGGAGTIRMAITRMVTMDTVGTRTAMDTPGTVTKVAPVMDNAMEAERVMDMAMAVEPVTDT